jgi:four helix bundle protein
MRTHKDLEAWRNAIDLARDVYEATKRYPREEQFGLISQMRRSVVSIASNIAEGAARNGRKEFVQFLYIALGSASELDTHIEISKICGVGDSLNLERLQDRTATVKKLIFGLIRSLRSDTER